MGDKGGKKNLDKQHKQHEEKMKKEAQKKLASLPAKKEENKK